MSKRKKTGEVCIHCSSERTEGCGEWRNCEDCGGIVCLRCRPSFMKPVCNSCQGKRFDKEREALMKSEVRCLSCNNTFLAEEMSNPWAFCSEIPYHDSMKKCKGCVENEKTQELQRRKDNAILGLVEVVYGEHPVPDNDGGKGYAYFSKTKLRLGDVVEVPRTWVSDMKGGENIATVVSTFSDYNGRVSHIIKVLKNGNRRRKKRKESVDEVS